MKKILITMFMCFVLCGSVISANWSGTATVSRSTTSEVQYHRYVGSGSDHKTTAMPKVSYATKTYALVEILNINQLSDISSSGYASTGWLNSSKPNPVHSHYSSIVGN